LTAGIRTDRDGMIGMRRHRRSPLGQLTVVVAVWLAVVVLVVVVLIAVVVVLMLLFSSL